MILTYKYKLYRTNRLKKINQTINIAGTIYNHCIALYKRYYKFYGKYLNKYKIQKHLTKLKKLPKYSYYKKAPSQSIQDITDRIDKAYKAFFKYLKKKKQGLKPAKVSPPTFKKISKYKSYTLKQAGYRIERNIIWLNGYKFKLWLSRPIDGKIKTITVKRDNVGDYWICVAIEKQYSTISVASGKIVGIDFGLKTFLTLSDETQIQAPRHYLKALKEVRKLHRYKVNLIKIDRYYPSTKTCSICGYVNENISLKERKWICPECGTKHNRDINASINICRVGASTLGINGVRLAICQQSLF